MRSSPEAACSADVCCRLYRLKFSAPPPSHSFWSFGSGRQPLKAAHGGRPHISCYLDLVRSMPKRSHLAECYGRMALCIQVHQAVGSVHLLPLSRLGAGPCKKSRSVPVPTRSRAPKGRFWQRCCLRGTRCRVFEPFCHTSAELEAMEST